MARSINDCAADGVWRNLRLAASMLADDQPTSFDAAEAPDGAIVVQDGLIAWVGPSAMLSPAHARLRQFDCRGAPVTPGLIDCHTHLVYAGQRANEFAMRLEGASYEQIARSGGGVASTVRATRAADEEQLFTLAAARLEQWLLEGVCAIEIKSGYGLALEHERKQLRVARRLAQSYGLTVRSTFLGAHATPSEYAQRSDDYIELICREMLPALAAEGLVDAVDVYCEQIAFSPEQTARVFEAAQALGLPVKLHAEQLSNMNGAALAAKYGALSCDHLEYLSDEGIAAMQVAGTVAVLLPGAFYTLRDTRPPPVDRLRAAGVPMAVATDHNPGTSPLFSLLLSMNMACTLFRLTVAEAFDGVTRHAARALGLQDSHGAIGAGRPANFVLWDVRTLDELVYACGRRPACTVVRQGRTVIDGLGVLDGRRDAR
ncbi:MAG TPA: imidazolonepropionase [Steroidobacter sp.]|nr:imidazolonepropionase [Steroidobacter sp.]